MPANKIGAANISETTSLLTKEALQKVSGFLPDVTSLVVRPGYHVHSLFSDADHPVSPLCVKGVTINGENLIFIVGKDGFVYVSSVNRFGKIYVLARRYFKYPENIYLFNRDGTYGSSAEYEQNTSKTVRIISVAKSIYILSNEQSWLIKGDGMLMFDDAGDTCWVDALCATVHDINNETPKLQSVGRVCSMLRRGDLVYVRAKSELGGYGAPSSESPVPETNGYIVHGIKGMTNNCEIDRRNILEP